MVIVDTSVYSFGINLLNGVPIIPFNKSTHNDDELKMLIPLLKEAAKKNDVRDFLKDEIKLIEIAEEALEYK